MRTFVIGDIHGAHLALEQCLERCGFDRKNDRLITLGDICDGWAYVYECVEILLTIPNRIDVIGNHDDWFLSFLNWTQHKLYWRQGGHGTLVSYARNVDKENEIVEKWREMGDTTTVLTYDTSLTPDDVPMTHQYFFRHQELYYHDRERDMFFVHGGFERSVPVIETKRNSPFEFYWNRDLWNKAMCCHGDPTTRLKTADNFGTIFIGHTATTNWTAREKWSVGGIIIPDGDRITTPMFSGGIWNIDTGAGMHGRLTIMDVDTKEYWQSDLVTELYTEETTNR